MNKIRSSLTVCFYGLFASFSFVASAHADSEPSKFRIGAILALSGDAAAYGRAVQNGIHMALDSLPPGERNRIEVSFEDDGMQSVRSVGSFRKLISSEKVNAIICFSSSSCKTIAPLAEGLEIPVVAVASDALVSKGRKFVFNFWVTPEDEAKVLTREAVNRGYKRVAAVSTTHDGSLANRDAFIAEAKNKLEIVFDQHFPVETKDFRTEVVRIAGSKPDAVMLSMMPGHEGIFAKQLRAGGVNVPIFGFETIEELNEVKASGGALVGTWFVTAATSTSGFTSEYERRFPGETMVTANNGYDAIHLLAKASAENAPSAAIANFLATIRDFSGASGTFSASGDNRFTLPVTLKEVVVGGFRELRP